MKITILFLSIFYFLFAICACARVKQDKKRKQMKGDNIGMTLYSGQVTTQAMKRPQRWFFNVMIEKPNEKYFRNAEYNGLRYQTELLQNNLDKEYNDYVREFYDEKLNVAEQKLIRTAQVYKELSKSKK